MYFNFRPFIIFFASRPKHRRDMLTQQQHGTRVGKHCNSPAKPHTFLRSRNKSDRYEYARVLSFTRSRPRAHSETGSQLIYIWLYPVRHPILVAPLINGLNIRPAAIWIVNFVEPSRGPPSLSSFSVLFLLFSFVLSVSPSPPSPPSLDAHLPQSRPRPMRMHN